MTNDLTEPVMAEALSQGSDMILSYHPPIFRPMKRFTSKNWKVQLLPIAIARGERHNDLILYYIRLDNQLDTLYHLCPKGPFYTVQGTYELRLFFGKLLLNLYFTFLSYLSFHWLSNGSVFSGWVQPRCHHTK